MDSDTDNHDYKKFEERRWTGREQGLVFRHRAAADLIRKTATTAVLDIGCGDGVLESFLSTHLPGATLTGIDLSAVAIEAAKKQVPEGTFIAADVLTSGIPFPDHSFETVVALDVLEHLFSPQDLLTQMKGATKKFIIVGVPNFSSLPARLQVLRGKVPENNRPQKGHVYWFNYHTLSRVISEAGFSIEEIRMNYPLERLPFVGSLIRFFGALFPNLFAL